MTDSYGVAQVMYTLVAPMTMCTNLADALFINSFPGTSGYITLSTEQYNKKLCVRAIDLVGNAQTTELTPLYVDRTAPTGAITAQLTSSTSPTIEGTVTDNFGTDFLFPSLFSLQLSGGLGGIRTYPLTSLVS